MSSPLINSAPIRPSKRTANKDTKYDLQMAKFYVYLAHNWKYEAFKSKTFVNRAFANGDQWIFSEDLDTFLLDQGGGFRNRVRFIQNIIKPIIRQYVGSAIKTDYSYTVYPSSDKAISRKNEKLMEFILTDYMSKKLGGFFRDFITENLPVGETEAETADAFNKNYKDKYVDDMRRLVSFISTEVNDIEELKIRLIKRFVTDGVAVAYGYERNKQLFFDEIDAVFFLRDHAAKKPNLSDGEFMGDWYYTYPTAVFDKTDIGATSKDVLEEFAKSGYGSTASNKTQQALYGYAPGNVPVYRMFWKDIDEREFGYVKDEMGNMFYTRINHDDGKYKTKDLVPPPKYDEDEFKGKKSVKKDIEDMRFCEFIPANIVGGKEDIVLASGSYKYQERSVSDPSGIEFPYKAYTWDYSNGEIYSPIDDIISPQRFINRALSMGEAQLNNARPGGSVFSRTAIAEEGEEEIQKKINMGESVFLNTDTVNNSIGEYRSTYGNGTAELFNIAGAVQDMTTRNTGMNDAMMGNVGGKRELKGVVENMIQRGSLMIEDVFFAMNQILKAIHQACLEQGKLVYRGTKQVVIDAEDQLQVSAIEIIDEHIQELFKLKLIRTASKDEIVTAANMMMIQMFQLGLLDDERVAKLFNKSGNEEIGRAMEDFTQEKRAMEEAAAQAGQQQQQQAQVQDERNMNQQMQHQDNMSRRKETSKLIGDLIKKQ